MAETYWLVEGGPYREESPLSVHPTVEAAKAHYPDETWHRYGTKHHREDVAEHEWPGWWGSEEVNFESKRIRPVDFYPVEEAKP